MRENEQSNYSESYISMKEIISTIYKHKWAIIFATFISAIAMYVSGDYVFPKKYQSTAVVTIIQPDREGTNITPRVPAAKELASLAQSSEIYSVFSEVGSSIDGIALAGKDEQIQFKVTALSPDLAADLANAWAAALSHYVDENYSVMNVIDEIESQQTDTKQMLDDFSEALENYILESQIISMEVELEGVRSNFAYFQSQSRKLEQIIGAAQSLESQLTVQNQETPLTSHQRLSIFAFYFRETSYVNLFNYLDVFPKDYSTKQALQDLSILLDELLEQKQILDSQINNLADDVITYRNQIWLAQNEISVYLQNRNKALSMYNDASSN